MNRFLPGFYPIHWLAVFLCAACVGLPVWAAEDSGGIINHVGSVFDDIARGLNRLGEKAQNIMGPGLGFGENEGEGVTKPRDFDKRFPVKPGTSVTIANQFGEIRVQTWDDPVVQVSAKITVRAQTAEMADEVLRNVDIQVTPTEGHLDVRTILNTLPNMGEPSIAVNYALMVPRDTVFTASNYFGDTVITGLSGALNIDAGYGTVDLRDLGGPVAVRARGGGEFALLAHGLRQGGTFELHRARAEFGNIAGTLKVDNFRGSVELVDIPTTSNMDIVCESGPIVVHLPENASPDLTATALFGAIQSDVALNVLAQGNLKIAKSGVPESATQHIALRTSFADISVRRQGPGSPVPVVPDQGGQSVKSPVEEFTARVAENTPLRIEAIAGNITVTGADTDRVTVKATKVIRVQNQDNVRVILDTLSAKLAPAEDGSLKLISAANGDLAAMGCSSYRVDLAIECPRTVAVTVAAQDGLVMLSGLGLDATVQLKNGPITVKDMKASVHLSTEKGDIRAVNCAGSAEVLTRGGAISLADIMGKIKADGARGRILIETPHGDIEATNTGDDIRVLSLDMLTGNYTLTVEKGNITVLVPPTTDASISATAENGAVFSAIELPGVTKSKDVQEFNRVSNTAQNRVTLHTKNGNIIIN